MEMEMFPGEDRELQEFRAEVAEWLRRNKPKPPKFSLPFSFLEVHTDDQFRFLQEWQCKLYEAGYLGLSWPVEYGGYGRPQIYQDIANEEMARARVPFVLNVIGLSWAGPAILKMGTEEQKRRYIRKILTAEEIWCQGFSEPDYGSDLASIRTTARRAADKYIINGHKIWATLATYAKHMILLARTDPDAPRYKGLSFFLCPMDTPGIEVLPIRKMTGELGFNEVIFEEAAIPADSLVGEEGQGWWVAVTTLLYERGAVGGQAGGNPSHIISTSDLVELAREAQRDGRPAIEDPIIRDELVKFMIMERAVELNKRRLYIEKLLTPERPHALRFMSKLFHSEYVQGLCELAVKMQGARACLYMGDPMSHADGMWQRYYMNSFGFTIGGGTSEVQRNILGERILGLAKG
jgi:alkylation response protein AidB-like acyl-CoA dehydrogenase